MNYEEYSIEDLEQIYVNAKELYYVGESPLSDSEFDEIEAYLTGEGSDIVEIVGFADRNAKFPHISPMGSQGKFQATETTIPSADTLSWMIGTGANEFIADPKFDGNSINIIYKQGKLYQCLTRGTGTHGRDITKKMKNRVPSTISITGDVEVRGEVVIKIDTFNTKYFDKKNPRNLVAGLLNRKDEDIFGKNPKYDPAILNDLDVMAFEIRQDGKQYTGTETLDSLGFNTDVPLLVVNIEKNEESFLEAYHKIKQYREMTSPYQLDGMVIKVKDSDSRVSLGENSHHPNWSIAIKYPPQRAVTTIVDIKWNMGKTGELTPVAIFEPTDLDGTTVKRASMHNYGYVLNKKLFPGAQVVIAKKGDIIPQIIEIVKPSDQEYEFPTVSRDGDELKVEGGIHLVCANQNSASILKRRLTGIRLYGVDNFGGATIAKLYDSGIHEIHEFFEKFTEENMIASGEYRKGRELEILINEFNKIKEVKLETVINSLNIDNVGRSISREVAKMICGQEYSFASLDRKACSGFEEGGEKRVILERLLTAVKSRGINIIEPVPVAKDAKFFEMTGSPKNFGFKTKGEFLSAASDAGFNHGKLNKEAAYLLTDSLTSSSSKMKKAEKLGVEVITYGEFIERHA